MGVAGQSGVGTRAWPAWRSPSRVSVAEFNSPPGAVRPVLHLGVSICAACGVNLEDSGEKPGPVGFSLALGRGGWRFGLIWSLFAGRGLDDGAGRRGVFSLASLFNAVPGGVGAVEPGQVGAGRRDVHAEVGEELEGLDLAAGCSGLRVGSSAFVDKGALLAAVVESLEGNRRVEQVAGETLYFLVSCRIGTDGVVHREAGVRPGEHRVDLFSGELLVPPEHAQDAALEVGLGGLGPG